MIVPLPKTVLVTGATGHTGERAVRRLLRLGCAVRALTRHTGSPVSRQLASAGAEVREGDCIRRWSLWEAMEGCDAVVTCSHIRYSEAVLQACRRLQVERLVCLSSARRYSRVPDPTVREVAASESLVRQSELDWTILRPTMIFGGRRDGNLTRVVEWFRKRSWYPLFGWGKSLVQPVYVEDLVDAVTQCLRQTDSSRMEIDLAGPEPMTYADMIRTTARSCGIEIRMLRIPVWTGTAAVRLMPGLARKYGVTREMLLRMKEDKTCDIAKAQEVLNYRPIPFEDAMKLKAAGRAEVEAIYGGAE